MSKIEIANYESYEDTCKKIDEIDSSQQASLVGLQLLARLVDVLQDVSENLYEIKNQLKEGVATYDTNVD